MQLLFIPDSNVRAFPGPLGAKKAAFGEDWVGPLRLLDILETQLGLGGAEQQSIVRAARLVPRLREIAAFWSESVRVDPLGVAKTLLHWRDTLFMHGWRGQGGEQAPRLEELAQVTQAVAPGMVDRLIAVGEALKTRSARIDRLRVVEPPGQLPRTWRDVLGRLQKQGTAIEDVELSLAPAEGDLAAARQTGFAPAGDGTLQLVRAPAPLQAADELAAWLAAQDHIEQTVIIGADAMLDAALHRHGLPTSGASTHDAGVLLQILPLVMALVWDPPDPHRAVELMTLPLGPIPRGVARRLVEALQAWPAVGGRGWQEALQTGLETMPEERRDQVKARIDALLLPAAQGSECSRRAVEDRLKVLTRWLETRREHADEPAPWQRALGQCAVFSSLVEALGEASFTPPLLSRLTTEATHAVGEEAAFGAEAGMHFVAAPDAFLGGARRVVWWRFQRDSAPAVRELPLRPSEIGALKEHGVELPDPGQIALRLAKRWRRPLIQATHELILCCSERDSAGEALFPHPLWDEVVASMQDEGAVRRLVARRPRSRHAVPVQRRSSLPLARPRRLWSITPGSVPPREKESPSSLGLKIGCSFGWSLQYAARLRGGTTAKLGGDAQLEGSVAHEILAILFEEGVPESPEQAQKKAEELFDELAPTMAADYFRPGGEALAATVRLAVGRSAAELTRQLQAAGLGVIGVEMEQEGKALGAKLGGRADFVAGPPTAIIDFKRGSAGFRRGQLEAGTAYQLACYSHTFRAKGEKSYPPVAYFILQEQRLLTTDAETFPGGETVDGPGAKETWQALKVAHEQAARAIADGELEASAIEEDGLQPPPAKDQLADGELVLTPPCHFCDFQALCGVAGEVA